MEQKDDLLATSRTTSDAVQFNFYKRDKSAEVKKKWKMYLVFAGAMVISIIASLVLFPQASPYLIQLLVIGTLIQVVYLLPSFVKLNKLESRGNPYYSIGIDFATTDILIKTGGGGMYGYDPGKIKSLKVSEISKEASFWSIDGKVGYKVAHELVSEPTQSLTKNIEMLNDNRVIVKLIALLLLQKKKVSVVGANWNLQNMLFQEEKTEEEKDEYKETIKVYKKNEKTGKSLYIKTMIACLLVSGISFYLKKYISSVGALGLFGYLLYVYWNNLGFRNKIQILKKESNVNESLKNSIDEMQPDMAYILTVPYSIIYPHKKSKKEMEKVLIMGKNKSLFIVTSSGVNLMA